MTGSRLAIVGGDAAGMSAASIARRRDEDLEIVAFERGPYTSYSACGIPYFVGGLVEHAGKLINRSPRRHRAAGIDVRTRCEVVAIDLDARRLTARSTDGREYEEPFDQLVVATGAEPVRPPIPGAEAIEPAQTVDAAERLRRAAADASQAELELLFEHARQLGAEGDAIARRLGFRRCIDRG